MNWDAIGATGEILGALSVLITLIYLASQVTLTRNSFKFSTARDIMDKFDRLNGQVVADEKLRNALMKEGELTSDEEEQVYTFTNMYCNTWQVVETAYRNGLIDDGFYAAGKKDVLFEMKRWPNFGPFVLRWLENYPEFKEYEIFKQVT